MEKLPVEIVHRIFDHLDIETIFFSIRPVCRLFRSIIQSYDRFDFHLKIISKAHFDVLCRFIPPENIRSLTLYHNDQIPDQISLFLSKVHLRQLTRLHSIDLHGIEEFQLNYLFERINLDLLKSFSIQMKNYDNRRRKTTANHLSTIVKEGNLRNLHLNIQSNRISEIEWSMNCSIECLTLSKDFTFDNLVKIFSCSPQLHRLIIKENFSHVINANIVGCSFPQLRSLIIEQLNCNINELESFLFLTPSVSYLKLKGRIDTFDGKRWEEFLQVNLPHLDQFQFDIICHKMPKQTREDLELILQSYRSSFWIEYKKWFVGIDMNEEESYKFQIYSIPIGKTIDEHRLNGKDISLSTSNEIFDKLQITEMVLRFPMSLSQSTLMSMNSFHCPNLRKLHFHLERKPSINLKKIFSKMINLSQLIELKLESDSFNRDNQKVLCDMVELLKESSKLSILIIYSRHCHYEIYSYLNGIFPNLPSQINYLYIPIKEVKNIEMILERCAHLKVIQFPRKRTRISKDIEQWFEDNTSGSIFRRQKQCDTIWIGRIKQENHLNHKRIKVNHNDSLKKNTFLRNSLQ